MLRFTDLDIGYRTGRTILPVLSGLNGEARAGEFVGLVGPNGAGKSTLLRTLIGLQPALGGAAWLNGRTVATMTPSQIARQVAVVLTDRISVGRLTVAELVALGRHPHTGWNGRLSDHDRDIVAECLAETGASELAERLVTELSDGQRQRVMVARALAQEPHALLLDEPTSFLDPPSRIRIFDMLQRLAHERGLAVIVCTHDIEVAARYCDELWIVTSGSPMRHGAPEDLALAGALADAFGGAAFELGSLTFGADTSGRPLARVIGEGDRAYAARHCLRRAGYAVRRPARPDEQPVLIVSCEPDSWTITHPHVSSHATLDSLARSVFLGTR